MIGTIICRNCDTAIEVSERDVSTFESQGAFNCPSCKEDLSARMADLLGTSRPAPAEERTVPEEGNEAYEGLPVGGSLDDAARAMRAAPAAAASSSMGVVPPADVAGEDPLTLALRIANQAKEQAEAAMAAAAAAAANGGSPEGAPAEPAEPTAPGLPSFANGNGAAAAIGEPNTETDPGVVPSSPDAEETVRKPAPAESAAETDLAPDTDDSGPVIGEETPALSHAQRIAMEESSVDTSDGMRAPIPSAPSAEATPTGRPPEAPREEPTIRKSGPPPALVPPPTRLAPRTGTGPSGIGALGFRISSNRAVVRPSFNGRANVTVDPHVSGSTSIDRPSVERVAPPTAFERPSRTNIRPTAAAPPPPVAAPATASVIASADPGGAAPEPPRRVLPIWAIGAGVVFVVGVTALFGARIVLGPETPTPIPLLSPTPVSVDTVPPSASPASTAIAVLTVATPAPTPTATPTATPAPATPAPTPPRSTPTTIARATPRSTPPPIPLNPEVAKQAREALSDGNRLALGRDYDGAIKRIISFTVRKYDPQVEEEVLYKFCLWSKKLHETSPEKLNATVLRQRYDKYLSNHPGGEHVSLVRGYIAELKK